MTISANPEITSWRRTIRQGVIFGIVALFVALVGLVGVFSERDIIFNVISMGQTLLLLVAFSGGYLVGQQTREQPMTNSILHGLLLGAVSGVIMAGYLLLATNVNLRQVFVNSSEVLHTLLSFGLPTSLGAILLVVIFALTSMLGSLLHNLEPHLRTPIVITLATLISVGILTDLLKSLLSAGILDDISDFIFARSGLTIPGALIVIAIIAAIWLLRPVFKRRTEPVKSWLNQPEHKNVKRGSTALLIGSVLIALPWVLQLYLSDVIDNVGIYILMGLGLNIVVGFAGLLDLGYVAFFAIGAYTTAILTSPESILGWEWSFWAALPVSMLTAGIAGTLLGIPVLRMRGDYLAIVTLGFGEIIRILALSEALKPYMGGSTGILGIPKPVFLGFELRNAQTLYYIIVAGCLLALYIAWRLSESRIGRAWVAIREDEDVAEAMGINLVQYKLMAFAIGAMLSGLAGAIFATKIGSVFPHSFNLIVSINVLSLIIVGGIASLPGVFVGGLVLVGLPELLREFSDYRLMMYGAALVAMMLIRPEGFWPAERRQRELHSEDIDEPTEEKPELATQPVD